MNAYQCRAQIANLKASKNAVVTQMRQMIGPNGEKSLGAAQQRRFDQLALSAAQLENDILRTELCLSHEPRLTVSEARRRLAELQRG